MVLTAGASPANTSIGRTSAITADFLYDNLGNYHNPALGHVPDGIPVNFEISDAQPLGSLGSLSSTTVNGRASVAFTASALGTAGFTVSVDNQQVSAQTTIGLASRKTKIKPPTVDKDGKITAPAALNRNTDTAAVEISAGILSTAFERISETSSVIKSTQIVIPEMAGAEAYATILPASALSHL